MLDAARYTDNLHLTRNASEMYVDEAHFAPSSGIYRDLNIALLAGLFSRKLRTLPDMWERRFGTAGPYLLAALDRGRCMSRQH